MLDGMHNDASPELEHFIDETIRLSGQKGYHPTIFIDMRRRHRTIPAIKRLVESGDVQSGFTRLKELGLLEWTIEAAVLKFPEEFPASTRECAEFRLQLVKRGESDA